jgi:hypothetical protein
MYKNATKCNETIGKWCKNKHGASKIIDTFETYQWPLKQGMHMFGHITVFPCVKQPKGSQKEAYYALYQMRAYVRDHHNLTLPISLKSWAEHLAMIQDNQLRAEFYRIQEQFATIIFQDIIRKGGMFYTAAMKPSNAKIDKRLLLQGDNRPFLLVGGGYRFVPDVGKL